MITIHQATFGDKAGGYALLSSSFQDDSIPRRIGNSTDVHDRPVGEILYEPIIRGFPMDDFYLIVKSFPHEGEGIRSGRVFSHALFIEKQDIEKVNRLDILLELLMVDLNTNAPMLPTPFDETISLSQRRFPLQGRAAYGVKGLLNHDEFSDAIAWVGKAGFFDFLCRIWEGFPRHLRKDIFFGAAFDPRKLKGDSLKIVHIEPELALKWTRNNFLVVEESSEAELKKESEFFLAGDRIRAASLEGMLQRYKLTYAQIPDLKILEKVIPTFQKLSSATELGDLIVFADLISEYNPNPHSAVMEKNEVLLSISTRLESAKASEILALRKVNWNGFAKPEVSIGTALQEWGKDIVDGNYNEKRVPEVILAAFGDLKKRGDWWHTAIREGVLSAIKNWASGHAKVIWEWLKAEPRLISFLRDVAKQDIPIEDDLLKSLPDFEESTILQILELCKTKKWLKLHGKLLVRMLPIEKALLQQLEIDGDQDHMLALRLMADEGSKSDFVAGSVTIGDKRLIEISGELVASNPALLVNLDVGNPNWREIWLKSILKGAQPWEGISSPQKSMLELLDQLLAGAAIDRMLVDSFATTSLSDLSDFHARAQVWNVLPASSRDSYLSATARSCVYKFAEGSMQIDSLERPLIDKLTDEDFFRSIAVDSTIRLNSKVALFQYISSLGPNHLIILLENNRLDSMETTAVGNLVAKRGWVQIARFLFHKVNYRKDFVIPLRLCYALLNPFERFTVKIFGYADVKINSQEWYDALAEVCAELLEKGPSQNGVWEAAGGKNGDLLANGSGKEIWIHALKQVKSGKEDVRIGKLLRELRKEFPKSEKLKQLEEVYPR